MKGTNTQLDDPYGMAIDANSNLWVASDSGNALLEFAAGASGNVAPLRTIRGATTTINKPCDNAITSAGLITLRTGRTATS